MIPSRRHGFTLIELLIVLIIIGLLASIAIPGYLSAQRRAFVASMTSDMRNLAVYQQMYHDEPVNLNNYAANTATLTGFRTSERVSIVIEEASTMGWSARATHGALAGVECVVYYGVVTPITTTNGGAPGTPNAPGEIACDNP